jgi:hypothetical protein
MALGKVLLSDSKIEEMVRKGFIQPQQYSWSKMADETYRLYKLRSIYSFLRVHFPTAGQGDSFRENRPPGPPAKVNIPLWKSVAKKIKLEFSIRSIEPAKKSSWTKCSIQIHPNHRCLQKGIGYECRKPILELFLT